MQLPLLTSHDICIINFKTKKMSDNRKKLVLITGGSRGLGKDMALKTAKKGFDVIITYNSQQAEAEKVVADIKAGGNKAFALQLDVSAKQNI